MQKKVTQDTFINFIAQGGQNVLLHHRSGVSIIDKCQEWFIDFDREIISLSAFRDLLILVIDDDDLYVTPSEIWQRKKKRKGNLYAYSYQGELLWNIDDIVDEDLYFPICGGHIAKAKEKELYTKWKGVAFEEGHEYYIALNYG